MLDECSMNARVLRIKRLSASDGKLCIEGERTVDIQPNINTTDGRHQTKQHWLTTIIRRAICEEKKRKVHIQSIIISAKSNAMSSCTDKMEL
jgi:hypothetical protein